MSILNNIMKYALILIVILGVLGAMFLPCPSTTVVKEPQLVCIPELIVEATITPDTIKDITELTITNTGPAVDHTKLDPFCLAKNIYHEARGEALFGRLAVPQVTLNRVNHKNYPDDICGVVMQRAQFSWTLSKKRRWSHPNNKSWQAAKRLADQFLNNGVRVKGLETALFYHTTEVKPRWMKPDAVIAQIGTHIFYESARSL